MDFSDLDSRWSWLVMVACFAASFIVGGANYSVGLIHSALLERYGESQANTALVGSLHTALMNLAAPLSGFIIDRFTVRIAIVTSGILFTSGYLGTAFAPTLQIALITCGVVSGLGGAVGWTATMVTIGFHFRRYRNVAQGIAVAGTGAGIFGIGPLVQKAGETGGSCGFFIAFACITFHLVLFGVIMRPSKLELYTQKQRFILSKKSSKCEKIGTIVYRYMTVLTNRAVTCISLSILAFCFGTYIVFLYLPTFCTDKGATAMQASYIISISGIASIISRLVTGALANWKKNKEVYLFSGSMGLLAVATLLFPLYSGTYTGQIIYAGFLGLFLGCPFATVTPINLTYLGVKNMASALGIELCLGGVGAVLGPVLAGIALDKGQSYNEVFLYGGMALVLASVLGFVTLTATPLQDDIESNTEICVSAPTEKQKMLNSSSITVR